MNSMSWSNAVFSGLLHEMQTMLLFTSSLSQSQMGVTNSPFCSSDSSPKPQYSKILIGGRGHKFVVSHKCPPYVVREAPMSRRDACPLPPPWVTSITYPLPKALLKSVLYYRRARTSRSSSWPSKSSIYCLFLHWTPKG